MSKNLTLVITPEVAVFSDPLMSTSYEVEYTNPKYSQILFYFKEGKKNVEEIFSCILKDDESKEDSKKNSIDNLPEGYSVNLNGDLMYNGLCIGKNFGIRLQNCEPSQYDNTIKFLRKLKDENISSEVFRSICDFLEQNKTIVFDDDGDLVLYKYVNSDMTSVHPNPDGSNNKNSINSAVVMARRDVCADRNVACSQGLHVCSYEYLKDMMNSNYNILKCKVDVRDIVSIPYDYNCAKVRVCKYIPVEVIYDEDITSIANNEKNEVGVDDTYQKFSAYNYTTNDLCTIILKYIAERGPKTIRELKHNCKKLKGLDQFAVYCLCTDHIKVDGFKVSNPNPFLQKSFGDAVVSFEE